MKERNLKINVVGIARSTKGVFLRDGIDPAGWRQALEGGISINPDSLKAEVTGMNIFNSVFVDCTASPQIASLYEDFLSRGLSVILRLRDLCSPQADSPPPRSQVPLRDQCGRGPSDNQHHQRPAQQRRPHPQAPGGAQRHPQLHLQHHLSHGAVQQGGQDGAGAGLFGAGPESGPVRPGCHPQAGDTLKGGRIRSQHGGCREAPFHPAGLLRMQP